MKQILLAVCLGIVVNAAWAAGNGGGVEVGDPWVREAPPMASMLAAYLELRNHGAKARILVSVDSPAFARVELHRSLEEGGMAKMVKADRIEVAPHASVAFEPGGLHMMLIKPVKPLKAGDSVPLVLHFSDGTQLAVTVPVRRGEGVQHDHDAHHQHHEH